MLEHHQEPQPASSRSLPVKVDFPAPELEAYLDRISPPPDGTLNEEARQELRAEMKTHLESLIAAYIELGDTPEQAVAKALQQFGDTRSVQQEWKRATASDSRQSLRMACALYGINFALFALAMSSDMINRLGGTAFFLFLGLWSVPAGFGTGFLARNHSLRKAFTLQTLLSLPALCLNVYWMLWPRALALLQDRGIKPSFTSIGSEFLSRSGIGPGLQIVLGVLLLTAACGILTGSLSAGFGGWLRKQNQRLRQHMALK